MRHNVARISPHLYQYKKYLNIASKLKGLAQDKIIKKSVILFWLLNMTICCKHVVAISSLTDECAAQKLKNTFPVLVYGHVYII